MGASIDKNSSSYYSYIMVLYTILLSMDDEILLIQNQSNRLFEHSHLAWI